MVLVCVDCYGSAALYITEAKRLFPDREIGWIHVRTQKKLGVYAKSFELTRRLYRREFLWNPEDLISTNTLISNLRQQPVVGIIGGMEEGARFEPILSQALDLRSNNPLSANLRRNKWAQQDAIRSTPHGVPSLLSNSVTEILEFTGQLTTGRIVLKPDAASGAVMVYFVRRQDPQTIIEKLSRMLGSVDQYGHKISQVVVQPEVVGDEYVVNTISHEGQTVITGLWRYHKVMLPNGRRVYFIDRPVDLTGSLASELGPIISNINKKIGLDFGPGHAELMHEHATGLWFLIESGARLMGTGAPAVEERVWGTSQLHLNLMRLLDTPKFLAEIQRPPRKMKTDAALVTLIAPGAGRYKTAALDSFDRLTTRFEPAVYYRFDGALRVSETVDLNSAPFTFNLIGDTERVKAEAGQIVRLMQSRQVFDLENQSCASQLSPGSLSNGQLSPGWLSNGIFEHRIREAWRGIPW